jgi:hypothetical protein
MDALERPVEIRQLRSSRLTHSTHAKPNSSAKCRPSPSAPHPGHAIHQHQGRIGAPSHLRVIDEDVETGVSNRLILCLRHSAIARAVEIVILRATSSRRNQISVFPSSTRVSRVVAPVA